MICMQRAHTLLEERISSKGSASLDRTLRTMGVAEGG